MISFVTWKWATPGYRSTFTAETVNALFRMIARHYPKPHRAICVTDDPEGIDPSIEIVPDWKDYANVPSPHGGRNPSCYRRLRMFHPEIGTLFGDRFCAIDQDIVITGDLAPIVERAEDIVLWGDTNPQPGSHYNGGLILMSAGCRPQVWEDFDPVRSPRRSLANRSFGSDQGWISYRLGPGEARYTTEDGVYSFRNHIHQDMHRLPPNARIVSWHGAIDPWSRYAQQIGWVREYWGVPGAVAERLSA